MIPTLFSILLGFFGPNPTPIPTSEFNDCSYGWREVDWKIVPFIDLNARYFSYQFRIPKGQRIQLKIEGDFPVARYASFHVYNQLTEDPTSHITDLNIAPSPGADNPFRPGVDRYTPHRQFTLWATASTPSDIGVQKLLLPFSETEDSLVDLWFRVYVSETSNISLPKILAFDLERKPISCPPLAQKEWSIATEPGPLDLRIPSISLENKNPLPMLNGEVHFFKPSTSSLGANVDNKYLSTRLDGKALFSPLTPKGRIERRILKKHKAILNIGNVTRIKFRVPTFPDTKKGLKEFSGNEDVRYWSICLSGADTSTSRCLMDSDVKTHVESDGNSYATIVVGPNNPELMKSSLAAGYNFMSHSELRIPILFFRQMLARPDFEGDFEKLLPLTPEMAHSGESLVDYYGETHIGTYSPVGKQFWYH